MTGPLRLTVLSGTRADYGLFRPLLAALAAEPAFATSLIVTGAHLTPRFGDTVGEIEADGYRIAARVPLPLEGDAELDVARAAAAALAGIAAALDAERPDLLIVLGDRYETLAGAWAALLARVPVAHLHGGELSQGATDDAMRHAVSKLAWLHFPATAGAARRLVQLGEEPERIVVAGALGVDNALREPRLSKAELEAELGPLFGPATALVTFHPVTLETGSAAQFGELLAALDERADVATVFTLPNADAGNLAVTRAINEYCETHADRAHAFASLGSRRYLSLLAQVDVCLGNSSSGIIEAPALGTPSVDIGARQSGRERAASVLHCEPRAADIAAALQRALSPELLDLAQTCDNPYGDGHAAERIVATLRRVLPLSGPLIKRFHDLPGTTAGPSARAAG
ncbi:MAG TPA: UDP-N-acetylglucosamine 2-epimerase [Thermoleophilia bacterium]|nr:UDP-N-acetylglucosamine 2-epimerase [Thermoleophilia bacterium]